MLGHGTVAGQILEVVRAHPECTVEELAQHLQELKWSEIFIEVARLRRSGRLRLTQSGSEYLTTLQAL